MKSVKENSLDLLTEEADPIESITIEHLTNIINNLNEKLVLLEGKTAELDYLRKNACECEKARTELALCLKEAGNKSIANSKAEAELKEELINKNKKALTDFKLAMEKAIRLENEKRILESDLEKIPEYVKVLESNVKTLKVNMNNEEAMSKTIRSLLEIIKDMEEKHQAVIYVDTYIDYATIKHEYEYL